MDCFLLPWYTRFKLHLTAQNLQTRFLLPAIKTRVCERADAYIAFESPSAARFHSNYRFSLFPRVSISLAYYSDHTLFITPGSEFMQSEEESALVAKLL
jgi:hypothetical protein